MKEKFSIFELYDMKDRYIYLAALGAQGLYGDNNRPKPNFYEIDKVMFWNEWNKLKGMPKVIA